VKTTDIPRETEVEFDRVQIAHPEIDFAQHVLERVFHRPLTFTCPACYAGDDGQEHVTNGCTCLVLTGGRWVLASERPGLLHEPALEELVGKTLAAVTQDGRASIDFVTTTGDRYRMHHRPDCCESVEIEDVAGDLQDLVGTPIVMAEASTNSGDPKQQDYQDASFTWTFYKLATARGHVTIRWYGSSNGYYSEGVDFERVEEGA